MGCSALRSVVSPRLQHQLDDAPQDKSCSGRGSQESEAYEPDTQRFPFWGMSCSIPIRHDVLINTRANDAPRPAVHTRWQPV